MTSRRNRARRGRRAAGIVTALGLLALIAWLSTFSGRLFLMLAGFLWPEHVPEPVELVSRPPRVERIDYPSPSGRRMVADIYRPERARRAAHPALLVVSPATRDGLESDALQQLGRGLTRLGYVVMVAFPEGKTIPYLSPQDIADTRASLLRLREVPEVDLERVIGGGFSYGAGPLLLAATGLPPEQRPARFLLLGAYADLRELLRFATTGAYSYGERQGRLEPHEYVREMLGRSLVAWAPPADRPAMTTLVEGRRRTLPPGLTPEGQSLAALFLNRDPDRFDALYRAIPREARSRIEALTLTDRLGDLRASVYSLHPAEDRLVPVTEAFRLWDHLPPEARARLYVPPALGHRLPNQAELSDRPGEYLRAMWGAYRFLEAALFTP